MSRVPLLTLVLSLLVPGASRPAAAADVVRDSAFTRPAAGDTLMQFTPDSDSPESERETGPMHVRVSLNGDSDGSWRRAPFGDEMLTHPDPWRAHHPHGGTDGDLLLDYNRVDLVRYGAWVQAQRPETMNPRLGARLEYSTGRRRVLYGVQVEQPLLPTARFVLGLGMVRRTDHSDLEQIEDAENSLMLLTAHEDWRDYFEREGFGGYLSWRVPDFSTVSVHLRTDRYRSLTSNPHVHSWWHLDRPLRANPAIDDGDANSVFIRLERLAHRRARSRSGLYHWIELERSGGPTLRGDFGYTRVLADLRSVVRVQPATTLNLRVVGGSTLDGTLPRQREFVLGGVDGLRAHAFGSFHGDRVALGQAEYSIGLHAFGRHVRERGPQALLFLDSGTAWNGGAGGELASQRFAFDGGVGLATADDDLRVTFARNLQNPDASVVVTLRLNRPF